MRRYKGFRIRGHHSPDHQWDISRLNMFLLTPARARGIGISLRVRHEHRVFHRQAKGARVWVEVEGRVYRPGLRGAQGRVYAITLQTEAVDQSVIQGTFLLFRLWERVLFDSGASHSFIIASCVRVLGLEVETLEEPLHVSSPLGTKARIDRICRGCELEISGIVLTMDLRVMDMSKFEVILRMDWLTAHRIIIDCDRIRVTAYTPDGTCVMFQGNRHDASPHTMYDSRWHGQLTGWIASLTLKDKVRQNMSLPRVVCDYEDVFLDEVPGLPPPRDVDFHIELHPSTSPISMTPYRMASVELQELKV